MRTVRILNFLVRAYDALEPGEVREFGEVYADWLVKNGHGEYVDQPEAAVVSAGRERAMKPRAKRRNR